MKTVFFESLRYKLITKNDFYYGSCPDVYKIGIYCYSDNKSRDGMEVKCNIT